MCDISLKCRDQIFISALIEWLLQMWMNICFEILHYIVCYANIQIDQYGLIKYIVLIL